MNQKTTKPQIKSKNIALLKDDDLAPKGRTKHIVETDWPTQEVLPKDQIKNKKESLLEIKKTENARLP